MKRQWFPAYRWLFLADLALFSFLQGYGLIRWWISMSATVAVGLAVWTVIRYHDRRIMRIEGAGPEASH
jgi:hypothetical protein